MTALAVTDLPSGQLISDTQIMCAGGVSIENFRGGQASSDAHEQAALSENNQPDGARCTSTPIDTTPRPANLLSPMLSLTSITLDDLEAQRIALENRYRSLTKSGTSENGLEWGYGLDDRDPAVATFGAMVEQAQKLEADAVKSLQKLMRKHPLGPWVKAQRGIGEKLAARLLGAIGDPYWHSAEDRPRTVSELWAYCGLKPGQKRRKGQQSNWSSEAKMRAYLLAESSLKQLDKTCKTETGIAEHVENCGCGPYRKVIDARRQQTLDRVHTEECVRCGPAGKPAQPGTPWSKSHQLADALRVASKEILKDLWRESRRIHQETQSA